MRLMQLITLMMLGLAVAHDASHAADIRIYARILNADEQRAMESTGTGDPFFDRLDVNRDGMISHNEFIDGLQDDDAAALFAILDRNGDGVLDPDELANYATAKRSVRLARLTEPHS